MNNFLVSARPELSVASPALEPLRLVDDGRVPLEVEARLEDLAADGAHAGLWPAVAPSRDSTLQRYSVSACAELQM